MNKRQKKKYGILMPQPSEVWSLKYTLASYIVNGTHQLKADEHQLFSEGLELFGMYFNDLWD